jgi:outer membrane protein OmpA-like peptidoglycan-associated protein
MSLLTEHAIETVTATADTSPPPTDQPADAGPPANVATKSETAPSPPEDLARSVADMRNELFNLRTEVARSSETLARSVSRMGLLVTVVVAAVAVGVIVSNNRNKASAAPTITLPAQSSADSAKIDDLAAAVTRMGDRIGLMSTGLEATQATYKAVADAAKTATSRPDPLRPAGKVDCARLPADVKASEADFSIQFQARSAKILPSSERTLDNVAKMLALVPTNCVLIEGHADASGNTEKNIALSKERASSVLDYIAGKNKIERSYLVAIGRGSSNPPAGTDAADPANRRVVFRIVPTTP